MGRYTTRQAAHKLGRDLATIQRYIAARKIPVPPLQGVGRAQVRVWTDRDIEKVRKILSKIANGRKTRYQKERAKKKSQSKGPKKASKK